MTIKKTSLLALTLFFIPFCHVRASQIVAKQLQKLTTQKSTLLKSVWRMPFFGNYGLSESPYYITDKTYLEIKADRCGGSTSPTVVGIRHNGRLIPFPEELTPVIAGQNIKNNPEANNILFSQETNKPLELRYKTVKETLAKVTFNMNNPPIISNAHTPIIKELDTRYYNYPSNTDYELCCYQTYNKEDHCYTAYLGLRPKEGTQVSSEKPIARTKKPQHYYFDQEGNLQRLTKDKLYLPLFPFLFLERYYQIQITDGNNLNILKPEFFSWNKAISAINWIALLSAAVCIIYKSVLHNNPELLQSLLHKA